MIGAPAVAKVRFAQAGLHHWPTANAERLYLKTPHRHLFHVEAAVTVFHDDRQIEFHDLLDTARTAFCRQGRMVSRDNSQGTHLYDFGSQSCEALARGVVSVLRDRLPRAPGRTITVNVWEDGEVGAEVSERHAPPEPE